MIHGKGDKGRYEKFRTVGWVMRSRDPTRLTPLVDVGSSSARPNLQTTPYFRSQFIKPPMLASRVR